MAVNDLFGQLLQVEPLFVNKEVMRASYTPDDLPHRDTEIRSLGSLLVPALRGETPSNVFIYGKTGTGKTACVKYVGKELSHKGVELGKRVNLIYINCEIVDTQYRVLQNIANAFVPAENWNHRIPFTGWPTDEVYEALRRYVDGWMKADDTQWVRDPSRVGGEVTIIVLDEVDKLKGDEVLYNLTRINGDLAQNKVSVIGISNDLKFTEFLDPRVKSSLGEESMIFAPYDAKQLEDILMQRATMALKLNVVQDGVVPLCAALAAREHGDARRALDLLRVAAELAERDRAPKVTDAHVRMAQNKIELDRISEVVRTLPTQSKLVLLATILGEEANRDQGVHTLTTGEVFDVYKDLCKHTGSDVLTQRRITDLISELDMLGIFTARVISKGRYGRTREIQMSCPIDSTKRVLEEDELIRTVVQHKPKKQHRLT
ncbi:MAG: archaeal cell division control protein 6 [Thermoplasmata archaeon]|nr:archaeal cell division control protein 6 [Thermoplasmata archaeon]